MERTAGSGWLDDLEVLERQARTAQRLAETVSGTAESADGLIEATVSTRGVLTELILDPRVYRELDTDDLATQIRAAVNNAYQHAQEELFRAFAAQLPAAERPPDDDPVFGPFLTELDRLQGEARR
ncbi:YbaB/EbfC family nucleoid-associated protein [Kribbella sp. NPDC023972]|uniref:YbaB/EbfC family nucleoid-associated protein n=1 Tax=Kribbella sp. NPDC023972 TaxID=3154795 RepID=UPI0033CBD7C2